MNYIERNIEARNIPDVLTFNDGTPVKTESDFEKRREELLLLLQKHEYGYIPQKPDSLKVKVVSTDDVFCAGKAPLTMLEFTVTVGEHEFSFPVASVIPKAPGKHPAFVHINFRPNVPDKYMLSEEIVDRGYATFSFCYTDVTSDDGDFENGLCAIFSKDRKTNPSAPGKIALWAWAAMRVMDYIQTLDCIDLDSVAVVGHSRLGKTALVTGAFDSRFGYVISNCSGCSGAAVIRGKTGENIAVITGVKGCWFCPEYANYSVHEDTLPLDQHFLLAASAPRHVMIGSAKEDTWADPESEFISAYLAGEVYEKIYGVTGLAHGGTLPTAKTVLDGGNILYHIREGVHYFSREDWKAYMDYIDKCRNS